MGSDVRRKSLMFQHFETSIAIKTKSQHLFVHTEKERGGREKEKHNTPKYASIPNKRMHKMW